MAIYTEAYHDHYDASQLSSSDKDDLGLDAPLPQSEEDKELEEAIELEDQFHSDLNGVLDDEQPDFIADWFNQRTDTQVQLLAKHALDDDLREEMLKEAVSRNLAPSGEEVC
ncbi:MAG: hypothetical protein BWY74_00821 [Firmicutes bacterium ADurb.Bin419]|nr:MAG: hypothetical protein BWY74_00821 [Firmicutes bacterium ADurb.Bin419]